LHWLKLGSILRLCITLWTLNSLM